MIGPIHPINSLSLFWLYPKAISNPINAPKITVRYGLQVRPQALPVFAETRLKPYPTAAPIASPAIIFKLMSFSPSL